MVWCTLVMRLQDCVAGNVNHLDIAIVTVGAIQAGKAPNVIPDTAEMRLSVRALKAEVRDLLQTRITALAHAQAESFGARAEVDYDRRYPVLVNHPAETELAREVAREWLGDA